jgi:acyl-CoA synthetase (AMP-forming)/AMP-acid ligase II
VGEIEVSGNSLMTGYHRNHEATERALRDGWMRSGDLGFIDGGRLFVVGRTKDMIIKGGKNFHPSDIERICAEVAGANVGVVALAVASSVTGTDDLILVIETRQRDEAHRASVTKAVRGELLASLGVLVDEVRLVAPGSVPRTTSGKVRRAACVRLLQNGAAL